MVLGRFVSRCTDSDGNVYKLSITSLSFGLGFSVGAFGVAYVGNDEFYKRDSITFLGFLTNVTAAAALGLTLPMIPFFNTNVGIISITGASFGINANIDVLSSLKIERQVAH